ncbi:MAG: hypothetical protein ACP5PW_09530, partial [Candidatus Dormibacteria bacterium]
MLADDFGVGEEVKAAFAQLASGDLEVLRPLLRERSQAAVGDAVLAGLVAQQVLLDLSARTALDFATPADLAAWLAIRVPQTAALFLGAVAPLSSPPAPAPSGGLRLPPRSRYARNSAPACCSGADFRELFALNDVYMKRVP